MTSLGPHRLAVIAVGDGVFGIVVDNRMYARTFRDDLRQVEVTLLGAGSPNPTDDFTLEFKGGKDECAVAMVTPRSGTGMFVSRARFWQDS